MKATPDETEKGRIITCLPSFIIHQAVFPLPSSWSLLLSVPWTKNKVVMDLQQLLFSHNLKMKITHLKHEKKGN